MTSANAVKPRGWQLRPTLVPRLQFHPPMVTTLSLALPLCTLAAVALPAPASPQEPDLVARLADAEPPARRFDYGRAAWQIGAAMGLGVIWYQSEIELNKLDFDFDRTWSDQWKRLSTAHGYRFDDNNLTLNVGHAFMGAYYHQFARANGGSLLEALIFDFVTSTTWELTVEHREIISLNDTVVTTFGGVALGEGLFALGEFFARGRPTVVNRVLMGVVSPARLLGWALGDPPRPAHRLDSDFDRHGFATDAKHRFDFAAGGARQVGARPTPWQTALRLDLELVDLREYGRAGQRRRSTRGGEFTRIEADWMAGPDDSRDIALAAKASLWGHNRSHAIDTEEGRVIGHSAFFGTASAFDLRVDGIGNRDFLATVHLLGPALDTTLFRDRWTFRMAADVMPDFAIVQPMALTGVSREERLGSKTTVQNNDYYYALGVTSTARLEAQYRRSRAGVAFAHSHYDSIEGFDRYQRGYTSPTGVYHAPITHDANLTDGRLKLRVFSEAPLPFVSVKIGASLDYERRSGSTGEHHQRSADMRVGLHAAYTM